jgi:LytS/YehU family sensor histidine kinase
MVLNNAKEKVLTLEKELELLNTYIALEQMRFENKFEIEIIISPKIDTYQIELPPMLIQPYVENAIWHGLMPLKNERKGKLKIEIKEHVDALEIVIEDNGVGRKESSKVKKSPEHKSIGMELTQQRVEVLKNVYGNNDVKIIVNDLYDDNQESIGTRIEIIIPLSK